MANPAVAAARRALESKINPPKPEPVQNNFAKYKGVRTPIAAAETAITPAPEPAPITPPKQLVAVEPIRTETPVEAPAVPIPAKRALEPSPALDDFDYQPPKTRRDAEFDELSRVDTREREQADKEFSRFDQGPLLDQPAVIPDGYAHNDDDMNEQERRAKYQSIYSAVTMDPEDTDEDEENGEEQTKLSHELSANDRWAQIRRNAAERAARFSDDHGNRSRTETRTDDGETSGEESE